MTIDHREWPDRDLHISAGPGGVQLIVCVRVTATQRRRRASTAPNTLSPQRRRAAAAPLRGAAAHVPAALLRADSRGGNGRVRPNPSYDCVEIACTRSESINTNARTCALRALTRYRSYRLCTSRNDGFGGLTQSAAALHTTAKRTHPPPYQRARTVSTTHRTHCSSGDRCRSHLRPLSQPDGIKRLPQTLAARAHRDIASSRTWMRPRPSCSTLVICIQLRAARYWVSR